jgi:hypothetical protein
MTRTQIQLPDDLYRDLKRLAETHEWSLAETIRRGAELLLRSYPRDPEHPDAWALPDAQALGEFLAPVSDWRRLANEGDPR